MSGRPALAAEDRQPTENFSHRVISLDRKRNTKCLLTDRCEARIQRHVGNIEDQLGHRVLSAASFREG